MGRANRLDARMWAVAIRWGMISGGVDSSTYAAELRPHLTVGVPEPSPARDPDE